MAVAHGHGGGVGGAIRYESEEKQRGGQFAVAPPAPNQNNGAPKYKNPCRSPQTREERDLCQQWRMAEATEELVTLADRQLWATYVEIGALILTLAVTVAVSIWAVLRTINTNRAESRAYIDISQEKPGLDFYSRPDACIVRIKVRNYGQTPATILAAHFEFVYFDTEQAIPNRPSYDSKAAMTVGGYLTPQSHFYHTWVTTDDIDKRTERFFWIIGYVDYMDVYNRKFRCGYARAYRKAEDIFWVTAGQPNQPRNNLGLINRVGWTYDEKWKKAPK